MNQHTYRYEDPINSSADAFNAVRSLLSNPAHFDFLFCAFGECPPLTEDTLERTQTMMLELRDISRSSTVPEKVAIAATVLFTAFKALLSKGGNDPAIVILG